MNRVFRLVHCRAAGQWVPVSEETRGAVKAGRRRRSAAMRHAAVLRYTAALLPTLAALLSVGAPAQAAPKGGQVISGTGSVSRTGNTTNIHQTSNTLSLNWQSFDVASNEVVNFFQPSTAALAVNRILGNTGSQILGHLNANGQVWLINPNGILFGRGAQVNVGGLTASTLDVGDAAFSSNLRTFSGTGTGSVVNQGSIHAAPGGYVALLGTQVSNQGLISAQRGMVALGAGSTETLTFSGRQLIHLVVNQSTLNDLAENRQLIQADGGRIIMTAGAQNSLLASVVNNTGIVQARTVENHGGTITLLAGMTAGSVTVGGTLDATAPAGQSGGSIETSGAALLLAKDAKIDAGPGGTWRVDPMDLTIDAPAAITIDATLNSGTSVVEQTTSGAASGTGNQTAGLGDIDVNAAIAWSNPLASLTLTAYNAINVNASITGPGAVAMQAGTAINVGASITATGQVTLQAGTGNLSIAPGAAIEGDAGVTIGTGANFVNNSALNNALISTAGRWLVYSTNPTLDIAGSLAPNFIQYAAAFQATAAQAGGNGFLYSVAPSITVTALGGMASKTYDSGATAALTSATYTVTGALNGDTVNSMSATYQTTDVGSGIAITSAATAAAAEFVVTNAAGTIPVYGYGLAGAPVTAAIGTITAAQLSATIMGDTANPLLSKVYDGTTTATLDSGNYVLTGFANGQRASVNQPSSVSYASASAGPEAVNATFSPTNFVAGSGTKLSNYILPTSATGAGTVQQAPLATTGVLAVNKTYDGTTSDTLDTSGAGLYGKIVGDDVSLVAGGTGAFLSPNKGSNLAVTASGFSLAGAQAADYHIIQPTGLTASIAAAPLTVTGVAASSKVYDGTTTNALTYTNPALSAAVVGDVGLSISNSSGAFSSKNVGIALPVTAAGFALTGTNKANYVLTQPSGLTADITPAQLTVTWVGNPTKPYNGTTTAALDASNFTVTGFVSGEGATIPQTFLAQYDSANAGTRTVTATLAGPDYATTGGALLSNYIVPTTVSGPGTITQAPLLGSIVGNPTKVYDGLTGATLTSDNYTLSGFVSGEGVTVNQASGMYATKDAGLRAVSATLSAGNYTATGGTLLSNYVLPATLSGTGTITPLVVTGTVYAGITGNPTKPYDGTTAVTLSPGNFVLTGFLPGDGATVTQTVGQFASPNAGVQPVTATIPGGDFAANGSTVLSNYTLPTSAYGTGVITPVALVVTIVNNPTRVYNGSTGTVLASSNYSTNFIPGEGATITPSASINYASANAGVGQGITAVLTPSAYTANTGTLMSNYVLATSATGTGTITQAPLNVTGVYATNKVYDTTTVDPLSTSQHLAGIVGLDDVTLNGTATGAFADIHVGTAKPVTVSGLTIVGAAMSNYTLQPITGLTAAITPAPLTISGVIANSKPYDGSYTATLNDVAAMTLQGFLQVSDTATLSAATAQSTFASVNVGTGLKVSASGFTISGGQSSDYAVTQPSGLTANITPAQITAVISGNPTKVYDGSASTTLAAANYTLNGFATVGGVLQGAAVPQSARAAYGSPNAGVGVAIGSTLVLSDFIANIGTNLSNYQLPATGSGTGTITPAPITVTLTGNLTKVYDSTTAAALSSANYGLTGFVGSDSATVNQTSGVYASANAGSESVSAALTGNYVAGTSTSLSNYALPPSVTAMGAITRAPLTVTVSTTPQLYDGTTVDALSGATLSPTGVFSGDTPVLAAGTYSTGTLGSSGNAGTDTVTTAFGLTGTNSGNYVVTQPSGLTAVISPVQLNAASTASKVYDGTITANLSGSTHTTVTGFITGQGANVSSTGITGTFASPDVNTGIVVTGGALVAGNLTATGTTLLSNYLLPISDNGTGTITPKALTYTATPSSQQYGLTPTNLTGTIGGFVNGETLTSDTLANSISGAMVFTTSATASSIVGHYAINGSGLMATNYSVTTQAPGNSTALTITKAPLTVTGVLTTSRPYNGSSVDALSGATLSGTVYNGDGVSLSGTTTGTLANNGHVGTDAVTTSMGLTGTGSGNYSLTQQTPLSAVISAVTLTATSTAAKTYDGTTVASLSGGNTVFSGFVGGQSATVNAGVTGTFAGPNVGSGIVIIGALTYANLTRVGGWGLGDYVLPITDNGTGTISAAVVNLSGSRVYDAGVDAAAGIFGTGGTLLTGVGAETLTLSGGTTLLAKSVGSEGLSTLTGLSLANHGSGSSAGVATNYTLIGGADAVSVTPLAITVSGTAPNKTYDGTMAATVATFGSSGVLPNDVVTFAHTAASFNSPNVATATTVTIPGITAGGAEAGNYTVNTSTTAAASITPAVVNLSGSRLYDAGVDAAAGIFGTGGTLLTGVGAETLTLSGGTTLLAKSVGSEGLSTLTGLSLANHGSGSSAGVATNYTLIGGADAVSVTPLAITVSGTAPNKTYDGTMAATVATFGSSGVLPNDVVTFAHTAASFNSPNVATATTVTIPGITAGGAEAGNYTVNTSTTAAASITPAVVNLSGSRLYDAGVDAAAGIFGTGGTLLTGVGAETLTLSGGTTLLAKSVGSEGLSTLTGLSLANHGSGSSAGVATNYTLIGGADAVSVTPLAITVSGTAPNKTYDGTMAATVATFGSSGVLPNDVVTFAHTAASFNSPNVATATTVTIPGITAGGAEAGNYTVNTSTTAAASITPAVVNLSGSRLYDAGVDAAAGIFGTGGTLLTGVGAETLTLSGGTTLLAKSVGSEGLSTLTGLSLANHGSGSSAGVATNYTLIGGADAVTVAAATLTYNATPISQPYGVTPSGLRGTVSGLQGSDTFLSATAGTATFSTPATAASNVNSYAIDGGGLTAPNGNYTFAQAAGNSTALSITPAVVSLSGTRVYDAGLDAAAGIFGTSGTAATGVNGQTLSLSGSGTLLAKNVGAETASPTGLSLVNGTGGSAGLASNYTLVGGTDTVNVTPATLTYAATPLSQPYGITPEGLRGTVTGYAAGDTLANATGGTAAFTTPATAASNVNSYAIDGGGLTANNGNYTFAQAAGNATALSIAPAVVNLSGTRVYDAGLDAAAGIFGTRGTAATGVNGQTLSLAGSGTLAAKNVGPETVSPTGLTLANGMGGTAGRASNYTLVGGTDTVNVTPLGITVTGTGANKVYDGTVADAVTLAGTGVLAADSVTFAATSATFADKNVGTAKTVSISGISASGPDAGNYAVNSTAITAANITPATLTESALPVAVAVGQTPALTGAVSGLVPGDTLANATDGTLVWLTNAPVHPAAGTYAVNGAGLTARNYLIAQSAGNATALDVTAVPTGPVVTERIDGMVGLPLGPDPIATPYGVGSDSAQGNNTGNARRDKDPRDGNRHLADFTGRLALTLVDGGVRLPAVAAQ